MNRLRLKFEDSLPWDPALILEAMAELFPEIVYKLEQEHIDIMMENNLRSSSKWIKYCKENNLQEQGYYGYPWESFNKPTKQFFEEIFGKKKTEQEHIEFIRENNLRGSAQWIKYWKDNNLREQGYLSGPWAYYKKTCKQFFEEIFGKKKTEQEHIDIIRENNITGSQQWYKYWEGNNRQKKGYSSSPWIFFNKSAKQFFEEIFGKKKTKQEHIDIIRENNITSSPQWFKHWKDNNLQEKGYSSSPWGTFKKTCKQFFEEIYGKKIYKTEQEHVDIIKENNIRSGKQWTGYCKENNLQEKFWYGHPWSSFNKSTKQFFEEIYGKKKNKQEHIEFIRENNLRGSAQWIKYWKDNNLRERGYFICPWSCFNESCREFFEEIFGKKTYKSEQEHISFIIENDLTSSSQWIKYWKDNDLQKQSYLVAPWEHFDKTCRQFFEKIKK